MRVSLGLDFGAGLAPPESAEDMDKFLSALEQLASFTGGLSGISPRGVQPFLTELDNTRLQAELESVFQARGTAFAPAVEDMLERVKPLSDFLAQSVSEASNLFGRGMIAALEAATASDANRAFQQSLGDGIKEKILAGITESFIASGQFTDLLAPIQQTIRQFTQEAWATGQTPDIEAFRLALRGDVEDVSSRADLLRPVLEELQRVGFDLGGLIDRLFGTGAIRPPAEITINIAEFTGSEADAHTLARRLDEFLRPGLMPG